jgi:hypothetical protein
MKKNLLPALTCIIFSCYVITVHAQGGSKPIVVKSNNGNHLGHSSLLTGNIGTDSSKNFLGTKDAQPLVFRVNNQRSGYIDFDDFSQATAFGYQTLISNVPSEIEGVTGGIGNSAFGYQALKSNISGELNTAIGQQALIANTTGNINTAVGAHSLHVNTTGFFNTAIGSFALASNTEGGFNTATGDFSLAGNTTGSFNIANGASFTLGSNTEGSDNIATGVFAMNSNTTGNANMAYGSFSLGSNVTGNNNTALGFGTDVTSGDLTNATAIGNGALVDASNKVRIGNTDVTSIGGQVGWTNFSDERIKNNIQENVPGLAFIKALRPVTYHFSIEKENELLGVKKADANFTMPQLKDLKITGAKGFQVPDIKEMEMKKTKAISEEHAIEKTQFTGFLAQDVDKAAQNIGYDFSGVDKSGKIMGLRYSDFVVPLVKAVQELSKINDEKDAKIDGLQKQIDELKAMIIANNKTNIALSDASLEQNKPNPFRKTTTIEYTLPNRFTHAQILVVDESSKTLKRLNISGNGKGTVNVDAASLPAGAYNYSLIIDGRVISSKQMVLTNN